ncbi:hypothetical protein CYMTET_32760 [Cymbomonas tetramitiformis]|uniref:Reverse transcriptase domain-containing protein n=1 Tax=Cymbomonas tetramitiformis TaxID=36881 RepID=A0AAE0FF23_9CHLO|nr:hypothetical protein CYMTET_32760 [Cymbomonas tetramitiformis]
MLKDRLDEGPAVAALPVGTLVEVYWPDAGANADASVGADGVAKGVSREVGATGVDDLAGGMAVSSGEGVRALICHFGWNCRAFGGEGADLGGGSVASGHVGGGEAMGMAVGPLRPLGDASGGAGGSTQLRWRWWAEGGMTAGGGGGLLGAGVGGGSGGRGNLRAAGQAQGQHGGEGLVVDPDGLGEAGWTWLRGLKNVEAYKLFFVLPRLVLQPVQRGVKQGVAQVIKERCARFLRGEWEGLHAEVPGDRRAVAGADEERVLRDAVWLVKAGQLGKAAKEAGVGQAGIGEGGDVAEALELDEKTFDDVAGLGIGQLAMALGAYVGGARLVALLKDDLGVNIRPIACGEVLPKLVAKVICRQRAKAFRDRFCGLRQDDEHGGLRAAQIGVAVKGGANLGIRTVQGALDRHPEWVCVKADARNAFNAVHREALFEAIERDFPELWAWTDLCYGVDANLGFRLGRSAAATGCQRSRYKDKHTPQATKWPASLGGLLALGGTGEGAEGDAGRLADGVGTCWAPQSPRAHPDSDDHLQQVLGRVEGSGAVPSVGLVVKRWLEWVEEQSSGARDEPAPETQQHRAGGAGAEGLRRLSEA